MEPRDVAKLLQAVYPEPGETALALAAPYAAALLAHMQVRVTLRLPSEEAAAAVSRPLDGLDVRVVVGDLGAPLAELGGPYDLVVCEAAVPRAPASWCDAIDVGGRLGVVEREGPVGKARLYMRGDDGLLAWREVFDASPQMLAGFAPAAKFTF